jgi:hypothetical protein
MNIGNLFVIAILCFYINYILIILISNRKRNAVLIKNEELDKLRLISHKTLEEQLRFIDLKQPKTLWRFSWNWLLCGFLQLCIYVVIYFIIYILFKYWDWKIDLWIGISFMMLFPILMNWILKKFKMNE